MTFSQPSRKRSTVQWGEKGVIEGHENRHLAFPCYVGEQYPDSSFSLSHAITSLSRPREAIIPPRVTDRAGGDAPRRSRRCPRPRRRRRPAVGGGPWSLRIPAGPGTLTHSSRRGHLMGERDEKVGVKTVVISRNLDNREKGTGSEIDIGLTFPFAFRSPRPPVSRKKSL